MSDHSVPETPSPAVPLSELREVLGASLLGGAGWLRARLSGVTGVRREVPVTRTPQVEAALVEDFDDLLPSDQPGVEQPVEGKLLIGMHAAGAVRQSAVIVQVLWHDDHTELAAHTLKGQGARGAAVGALDRVEKILTSSGRP